MIDWTTLWPIVGIPILSNVMGYLQNALEDGVMSQYEWQELILTVVNYGIPAFLIWLGAKELGLDMSLLAMTLISVATFWVKKLFKPKDSY